jgi:hypothetical protein
MNIPIKKDRNPAKTFAIMMDMSTMPCRIASSSNLSVMPVDAVLIVDLVMKVESSDPPLSAESDVGEGQLLYES